MNRQNSEGLSSDQPVVGEAAVDRFGPALGIFLAAGISAAFWATVLNVSLSALGLDPSLTATAIVAVTVSAFVALTMIALRSQTPYSEIPD